MDHLGFPLLVLITVMAAVIAAIRCRHRARMRSDIIPTARIPRRISRIAPG